MRRNFFLQLLPDMEEVYYNGSTSDEDERAIFKTQQNGTLNTGEDSPKAVIRQETVCLKVTC